MFLYTTFVKLILFSSYVQASLRTKTVLNFINKHTGCHRAYSLNLHDVEQSTSYYIRTSNLTCLIVLRPSAQALQSKRVCLSWQLSTNVTLNSTKVETNLRVVVVKLSIYEKDARSFTLTKWQRDADHPQRLNAIVKQENVEDIIRAKLCFDILPHHQIVVFVEKQRSHPLIFEGMKVEIHKNNVSFDKAVNVCPNGHLCADNEKCVDDALSICDGVRQCENDGSDELNCMNFDIRTTDSIQDYNKKLPKDNGFGTTYWIGEKRSNFSLSSNINKFKNKSAASFDCQSALSWRCQNHKCISGQFVCDGINQCGDNSDEIDCNVQCDEDFLCINGLCIDLSKKCDQVNDCGDSSDEQFCQINPEKRKCTKYEFQCANERCINKFYMCKGVDYCGDGRDKERLCECALNIRCKTGNECFTESQLCNGVNDCWDKSDELDCAVDKHSSNNGTLNIFLISTLISIIICFTILIIFVIRRKRSQQLR